MIDLTICEDVRAAPDACSLRGTAMVLADQRAFPTCLLSHISARRLDTVNIFGVHAAVDQNMFGTGRRRHGDEFVADGQARKTAGRQTGSIFASRESRHELIVTRPVGNKGYGVADCPSLQLTGVIFDERHLRGVLSS